jgi:RimJ/RimL family protein N-acetyltransferase
VNFNFTNPIILENHRAVLRPLQISDMDFLLPIALSNEKLLQYSPKPIHSKQLLEQYIFSAIADKEKKERYPFLIFDKQAKAVAGSTSFLYMSDLNKRVEIGATWLGQAFQKTGLNRHCKFLLLSYAFDTLAYERVEFKTDERNIASRTAIEKIGGKLEGILRSHTVMFDGFRRNTACYSILKTEWNVLKEGFIKE